MSKILDSFLKHVSLPSFHGNTTENVNDWLSEVNEYFDVLNTQSNQRVQVARLLLRDNARRWVRTLPACSPTVDIWEYFQSSIKSRFQSPNMKFHARTKLYELKQRGSVTKYIATFEDLRSKIDDLGEPEAIQTFLNGLKPKLQEHFAGNPSLRQNLQTIMQIAESLDNIQYHNRAHFPQPRFVPTTTQESFPQPMELDAINAQDHHKKPATVKQKQIDLANRTCFYCHQPNHQARQCPNRSKNQPGKDKSQ
jgi:hypothetical protein